MATFIKAVAAGVAVAACLSVALCGPSLSALAVLAAAFAANGCVVACEE